MNDLRGLVLVGGKSARFGAPKAQLFLSNKPQWQRAEEILASVCKQVYFSVSANFSELPVADDRLIFDTQTLGPLSGIIAAFASYQGPWLVLACDMPGISYEAVSYLLLKRDRQKLASVFINAKGQIEPLCAVYELAILEHLLRAQEQQIFCPRKILTNLVVEGVKALDESWLDNINSPKDLVGYKKISLHFYARVREEAGVGDLEVFSKAHSMLDLFREVRMRFCLSLDEKSVRFACNDRLVPAHEMLKTNDRIVFIPPVSGG